MSTWNPFVSPADLCDPNDSQGRTYRQINGAKQHAVPLGALVELKEGARLFVVDLGRDFDMTPLYYLSYDPEDTGSLLGGFREKELRVVNQDHAAANAVTPETQA